MAEKLDLPFPLLSDPRGTLIKSLGLWNEEEGVSEPAIVVLDKGGTVQHLYSGGSDFSDRPPEDALMEVLGEVGTQGEPEGGEPEVRVSAEEAESETVRPDKPAMTLDALRPYYRGALSPRSRCKRSSKARRGRRSTATRIWSTSTTRRSRRPSSKEALNRRGR